MGGREGRTSAEEKEKKDVDKVEKERTKGKENTVRGGGQAAAREQEEEEVVVVDGGGGAKASPQQV